jgi:hypothetical protein
MKIEIPFGLFDLGQTPILAACQELEDKARLVPTSEAISLPVQNIDRAKLNAGVSPFYFRSTKKKKGWLAEYGITPL